MEIIELELDETLTIDGDIELVCFGIKGESVKVGIEAPNDIEIVRAELLPEPKKKNWLEIFFKYVRRQIKN